MGFDGWWFTDKLEDDSFNYGRPIDLDVRNTLVEGLSSFSDGYLMAKTDKYLLLLETKNYPALGIEAFAPYSKKWLQGVAANI